PDPYFECLKIYIKDLLEIKAYEAGDTVFVLKRDYLPDFTSSSEIFDIKMIDDSFIWQKTRNNKALRYLVIHPIQFENGEASIFVTNFGTSRKRKHYHSTNNGFNQIKLEWDCVGNRYIYKV